MELAWLKCGWDGDHADPCAGWLGWGTTSLPMNFTTTTDLNTAKPKPNCITRNGSDQEDGRAAMLELCGDHLAWLFHPQAGHTRWRKGKDLGQVLSKSPGD